MLELTGYIRYITTEHSLATGKVRKEGQMVGAYIEQHISVEIKNELNLATSSAYDVWSALKYWHDDRDCSELDRTYSKMPSVKLNGEAIEEYKKEFLDILKSLAKFGRGIRPDFLVHVFLERLGEAPTTEESTNASSISIRRRQNPNRTDSNKPEKKRLKSVVLYAKKDSRRDLNETADLKQQPDLREKLKKPQQKVKADPKPQEDLLHKLNRSKKHPQKGENQKVAGAHPNSEEEDGMNSPIFL